MGRMTTSALSFSLAVALGTAALPAAAHEAGDWLIRAGVTQVKPKSSNGTAAGLSLDVDSAVRPSISATYMVNRNLGVELLAATPFRHDIAGSGAAIGSTKHLPPTLSLQWHFLPDATVQPYVGVGLNYTRFFGSEGRGPLAGAHLALTDSWGLAAQVGVDVKLNERWFVNASVRYMDIDSKVKLNGAQIGKANIDPWVTTVGIGYRF